MSQSIRQSELFAGSDWKVLYQAFTQVNFNASDPPSIAAAMREYLRTYYPENFNDWIESSEFIAVLELLAWLGGTLAFKTDLNARESFLETAETRQSILRLARFLSYNPTRNNCAQGILKLVEIMTDDDVYDAYGNNLINTNIRWDDADDVDWFDKFTLILNSAFISANNFGVPLKSGTVGDVKTQLYRFNNLMSEQSLNFTTSVGGSSMLFDVVNVDFDDNGGFYEREPLPTNALHTIYRNDGAGNSSADTGFFFMFKQGTLQSTVVNIATPQENQVIDIAAQNVNETDVWVQTVTDGGALSFSWSKVPAIFNQNITYNDYSQDIRNIYSVITRDNDAISVRFSDGRFGSVPVGNIRIYYRVSNGLQYQIKPTEISRKKISVPYYNRRGVRKTLTLTLSLQNSVSNSTPRETDEQIQARAPSVYATQNRMVSGEDYNVFPLQSNLAVKLKAVNRVYSGHSRFIDLNDPTGTYQDVNVFSEDGSIFKEKYNLQTEIPLYSNISDAEIVSNYIQPLINKEEVLSYQRSQLLNRMINVSGVAWKRSTNSNYSSTGYFTASNQYIAVGATLLFNNGAWATIVSIDGDPYAETVSGEKGTVTLSYNIPDNATVSKIIPPFLPSISTESSDELVAAFAAKNSFSLHYDYAAFKWTTTATQTTFKVLDIVYYAGSMWSISANGERMVFESEKNVQWYNDGKKAFDSETGNSKRDIIKVLKTNEDLKGGQGRGFSTDQVFDINRLYLNRDGTANPRRVTITMADDNLNGYPDNPDAFNNVANIGNIPSNYLFWGYDSTYGTAPLANSVILFQNQADRETLSNAVADGSVTFQINGTTAQYNNTFWVKDGSTWKLQRGLYSYGIGRGTNTAASWVSTGSSTFTTIAPQQALSFQWKHYAPTSHRIDPSKTNIIDMFVLTAQYDFLIRQWIAEGADVNTLPTPISELDLRLTFSEYEDYKMFSDSIVWRPVKYKFLFGNGANEELKGKFKVVKTQSTTLSDGEIASRLIKAVNNYFDVTVWDFGETFYFTELSAYIHQQLANIVSSVVFVPTSESSNFGDGYEVRSRSDEIFISTAQVADVIIINSNTPSALRIR
jgi:hypothetical protein